VRGLEREFERCATKSEHILGGIVLELVLAGLVPDSLVPGNPYNLWISIGVNDKYMDNFESQNSIIRET
jgi:hypothetical protein